MKVRFKRRRSNAYKVVRLIIIIIVIIISFWITFKILYNSINVEIDSTTYLNYLVNDSFSNYKLYDIKNLSSTEFLLKYSFGIEKFNTGLEGELTTPVINSEIEVSEPIKASPLVYIYNSHQTESYKSNFLESFNINNTVFLASHILGEYLKDLGIGVIVEENSLVDILNANGWKYGSSYKASRILLEEAYNNNPSLKFFIDVHRDSASYDRTVTEIEGIKYAKVMFIIGLEHDNYKENLEVANNLNEKLKSINSNLSRGVLEKEGPGVNGIYNQDFNKNTILIEVGGQYNFIEEVNNTMKIMADIIFDYMKESELL